MSARTRALEALARITPWDHPNGTRWVIDTDEGLAHRAANRVYAVIVPLTDGRAYDVVCRDLISGVLIKEVRDLDAAAALAEANRLLRPL